MSWGPWIAALMGWPMVALGMLLLAAGVGHGKRLLTGVGAALNTPFLLYLAATPRFAGWALVALVLNFAAAFVVEKRRALAAALLVPGFVLVTFVAALVVRQWSGRFL